MIQSTHPFKVHRQLHSKKLLLIAMPHILSWFHDEVAPWRERRRREDGGRSGKISKRHQVLGRLYAPEVTTGLYQLDVSKVGIARTLITDYIHQRWLRDLPHFAWNIFKTGACDLACTAVLGSSPVQDSSRALLHMRGGKSKLHGSLLHMSGGKTFRLSWIWEVGGL